ncbi:MAG: arylsulfatase [Phycisphaeraceae bacterium]|nr:arylsulfatase [Phycisphaeraceae bacterium]
MSDTRPNIILIMDDQHRGDCLGCDGHPVLQTPNLDMLAAQGTRFSRGYSTCPSCTPALRALLCGQHPATNGMVGFVDDPSWNPAHTLPGELSKAGYQSFHVGRTLHQVPPRRRFGFDHMVLMNDHDHAGDYERQMRDETGQIDGSACHGLPSHGWTATPWQLDPTQHPTHWVINEALRFLETRDPSCPFFLNVQLSAPHPPLCPPAFYFDRYLRQELPLPMIGQWVEPEHLDASRGRGDVESPNVLLLGHVARSCLAAYFGLINHIDDQLFRLLRPRIRHGYNAANTAIIFASDHGNMLGDHGLYRNCEPYEGAARIPFIVWGGSELGFKSGQVFDQPVCLEDIMPTCLDLAGAPIPDNLDGRSLVPILRNEPVAWRPWLHGEHAPCHSVAQANHYLTDSRWKYIWRPLDGREQLFDLVTDPRECLDLAAKPAHVASLERWRGLLIQHLHNRPEGFSDGQKLIPARPYPKLLRQG